MDLTSTFSTSIITPFSALSDPPYAYISKVGTILHLGKIDGPRIFFKEIHAHLAQMGILKKEIHVLLTHIAFDDKIIAHCLFSKLPQGESKFFQLI